MRNYVIGFILGLIASAGITLFHHSPAVEGKPAPAIAKLPTETVPIRSVKVYIPAAKKKLDLPTEIQLNPSDHVTAATTVLCYDRDKTVTSVINDDGKSTLFIKEEPLPWFRPEEGLGLTLDWGQKRGSDVSVLRAGVRLDMAQTKALHFGVTSSVDGDHDWFYGVGIRIAIR